jgi:hypothetical protein
MAQAVVRKRRGEVVVHLLMEERAARALQSGELPDWSRHERPLCDHDRYVRNTIGEDVSFGEAAVRLGGIDQLIGVCNRNLELRCFGGVDPRMFKAIDSRSRGTPVAAPL